MVTQVQPGHRDVAAAVLEGRSDRILSNGPTNGRLRKRGLLLAWLLVLGLATQAWADVIVLQPFVATRIGAYSNLALGDHQQMADNFSLSQATALESISWFAPSAFSRMPEAALRCFLWQCST